LLRNNRLQPGEEPFSALAGAHWLRTIPTLLSYLLNDICPLQSSFGILKTPKEQRLSFQGEGSNSGAIMAFQDDAKWEANEFQMDRFGLGVKENNSGGLLRAGSKLVSMISGSKDDKKDNQCQVSGRELARSAV